MITKTYRVPLFKNKETSFSPDHTSLTAVRPPLFWVTRFLNYLRTHPLGCEIAARRIQREAS